MTVVIDASVAAKWFFEEPGHEPARALLDGADLLIAPSIILAEIANVAWKRFRRKDISREDAEDVARLMAAPFSNIVPLQDLATAAARLSLALDHPVHDCLYLAVASRERARLVTADRNLAAKAQQCEVQAVLL